MMARDDHLIDVRKWERGECVLGGRHRDVIDNLVRGNWGEYITYSLNKQYVELAEVSHHQ